MRLSDLADTVPWDEPRPDAHAAPSMLPARTFSIRSTWDPPHRVARAMSLAGLGD